MKDAIKKLNPAWALRLGLGLMYIYSGYDLFYNPQHWYGFLPLWLKEISMQVASIEAYLMLQGAGEFIIGLLLIGWFSGKLGVRVAAALATIEFFFILIIIGIDPITFRDIGLLGGSLALLIMSFQEDAREQI